MSLPRWLKIARAEIGVTEIPGPKHSTRISGWLARLKAWWRDDETPWCGVFVAYCMQEAGIPFPKLYMRATEWANWGVNLRRSHLAPGAVLVFVRPGGGHVGFYVGENHNYYFVLGGNQRNAVNITKIAKTRLLAARWPKGEPVMGGPVQMGNAGVVSDNEA